MRRLADAVVDWLLRLAPWYRPEEIEAREERTAELREAVDELMKEPPRRDRRRITIGWWRGRFY